MNPQEKALLLALADQALHQLRTAAAMGSAVGHPELVKRVEALEALLAQVKT